jgi:tRNA dimethylallyltransferase
VLCLAGPTAVGKTALALALAARHGLEIVSMDSALVYRGMDLGTAKPTPAERRAVPHHLIDILDPAQAYSAARFAADARRLIAAVRARGREPLLVGGTMLYFKALAEGLSAIPPADPALRAALDAEAAERGWPALHAELARVDPATAARLAPNDAQRIQRALEVWRGTGRPLSAWHQAPRAPAPGGPGAPPGAATGPGAGLPPLRLFALEPVGPQGRAWLHARIALRVDAMLDAGLVDEVRALRARADLHNGLPSMRAVGYRQVWQALAGEGQGEGQGEGARGWRPALREAMAAATRQLAKRQLTWLRSLPQRRVLPADADDALPQALSVLERALPR